jgi:hypothetical protein
MKLIRKMTWRDNGEEILGEERATLVRIECTYLNKCPNNGSKLIFY